MILSTMWVLGIQLRLSDLPFPPSQSHWACPVYWIFKAHHLSVCQRSSWELTPFLLLFEELQEPQHSSSTFSSVAEHIWQSISPFRHPHRAAARFPFQWGAPLLCLNWRQPASPTTHSSIWHLPRAPGHLMSGELAVLWGNWWLTEPSAACFQSRARKEASLYFQTSLWQGKPWVCFENH